MTSERLEWVEIFEPSSRNIMYANLATGKCVWDPPPNVPVKKFDENQWWELFDSNTSRFYYYNASTQKTVWHKPQNCDIIPLAKLQQIKQNTEVSDSNIDEKKTDTIGSHTPSNHHDGRVLGKDHFTNDGPMLVRMSPLSPNQPNHVPCQSRGVRGPHGGPPPSFHDPWSFQTPQNRHLRGLQRSMTSSMTQTSPAPSPRASRRASHHCHQHQLDFAKSNSGGHHSRPCHHLRQDANGDGLMVVKKRSRRSSQSSHSSCYSCSQPVSRESGKVSDGSLTHSRTSLESGARTADSSSPFATRESQRSRARSSCCSRNARNPPVGSENAPHYLPSPQHLPSPSTPKMQRRAAHDQMSILGKQRSFDVGNFNPKRSERHFERPKEIALSRSHSFMARPKAYDEEGMQERFLNNGLRSMESTPQPRRKQRMQDFIASSPESSLALHSTHRQKSDSSGLDSLATPMTHRKRFVEAETKRPTEMKSSHSAHTKLAGSDSSASPPSLRHEIPHFPPLSVESGRGRDSAASTLTDKDNRFAYGRGSPDSSPHSQFDSGLVSGTTGSRGSADSSVKRSGFLNLSLNADKNTHPFGTMEKEAHKCIHHKRHHCSKHRPSQGATDSDKSDTLQSSNSSLQNASRNLNSSSASSTTARQPSPKSARTSTNEHQNKTVVQTSPGLRSQDKPRVPLNHRDITHLYSNLDYVSDQPVYQFILEQAKLSGIRLRDPARLEEDADGDSFRSDDSGTHHDDSDHFADDEAMSNADSSSQEYLADDETYTQFFTPCVKNNHVENDNLGHSPNGGSRTHPAVSCLPIITVPDGPTKPQVSPPKPLGGHCTPSEPCYYSNVPVENQFSSLRRKREPAPLPPDFPTQIPSYQSNMKKPLSEADFERLSLTSSDCVHDPSSQSGVDTMEKYARENLNVHTRGILRKKVPVLDMISWTKEAIRKPMLATIDKTLKNQACELFKLVQIYMSDRRPKPDMTLNSVGLDIALAAYNKPELRDELFVQICRQTTENHKRDSLRRGWELLAICLEFFPPSDKFIPYLSGFISRHCDSSYQTMYPEISKWPIHIQINHYAGVCSKRLERTSVNAKRHRLKKPSLDEIDLARLHIFRASMFGGTIEEVLALQRDRYPHRRLPWIQTMLSEEILRLQGTSTEGIFRVAADMDEVNHMKQVVDHWETGDGGDPHVVAALLKLWYRELYQPLIPEAFYAAAVEAAEVPAKAVALVNQLPELNRLVLAYLIRFLQYFSQSDIVVATKMDANNLATVIAPNCLRCTSDDPKVIYENSRKEMGFVRTLILHLDTTFIEGVV